MSSAPSNKVHDDVQKYIRNKHIDAVVSSLVEEIIKYRPNYVATFIVEYLMKTYVEEVKTVSSSKIVHDLMDKLHSGRSPTDYSVKSYVASLNHDLQIELDKYLQQTNTQQIISSMVERVLLLESATPINAMIEFLCEAQPEASMLAFELMNPIKNSAKAVLAQNIAKKMAEIDQDNNFENASDSDEEDDEKKEEDEEDEEKDNFDANAELNSPKKPVAVVRGRNRRASVSSESLDPNKIKEQLSQVRIIPKDQETMQVLFSLVSKSPMLRRMLDPEERTLIIKAFAGPVEVAAGETIIKQGDIGDVFYLLESGTVDVYVRSKVSADEMHVHTYKDGDTFGQLALMYNAPRAATCKAFTDCKLWTLDRTSFKVLIAGAAMRKREMYHAFLSHVPILETMKEVELFTLADALTEERFEDGEVVVREGDSGEDFYLILDGIGECYKKNRTAGNQEEDNSNAESGNQSASQYGRMVLTLARGDYFGEIALLTSKPRQATVVAKGSLKVLVIDRATFIRVLGPLEDILKRNMEAYDRYNMSSPR